MKTTMKTLDLTKTTNDYAPMIIRLVLALIIFPHGAQHLTGWFGGYGYTGMMNWLTVDNNLPWIISFLVIMIEFFGPFFLLAGYATRIVSAINIVLFTGIIFKSHIQLGFFMDWEASMPGEGYEYHLLIIGMALSLVVSGGGKYSADLMIRERKSAIHA